MGWHGAFGAYPPVVTVAIYENEGMRMKIEKSERLKKLPPYLFADLRRKMAAARKTHAGGRPRKET